jgi:hypothetical protein
MSTRRTAAQFADLLRNRIAAAGPEYAAIRVTVDRTPLNAPYDWDPTFHDAAGAALPRSDPRRGALIAMTVRLRRDFHLVPRE